MWDKNCENEIKKLQNNVGNLKDSVYYKEIEFDKLTDALKNKGIFVFYFCQIIVWFFEDFQNEVKFLVIQFKNLVEGGYLQCYPLIWSKNKRENEEKVALRV